MDVYGLADWGLDWVWVWRCVTHCCFYHCFFCIHGLLFSVLYSVFVFAREGERERQNTHIYDGLWFDFCHYTLCLGAFSSHFLLHILYKRIHRGVFNSTHWDSHVVGLLNRHNFRREFLLLSVGWSDSNPE